MRAARIVRSKTSAAVLLAMAAVLVSPEAATICAPFDVELDSCRSAPFKYVEMKGSHCPKAWL